MKTNMATVTSGKFGSESEDDIHAVPAGLGLTEMINETPSVL